MDSTIVDMFAQGIDAFITSLIVSFMVIMLSQQQTMASVVSENHTTALEMQEYREYNAYDNRQVYAADIISLILKKKGYPTINVTDVNGHTLTWSLAGYPQNAPYNVDALYRVIDPRYIYNASLEYDDNDYRVGVKEVNFRAVNP